MDDLEGEIYDEFGNYIGPDLDENGNDEEDLDEEDNMSQGEAIGSSLNDDLES